MRAHLHQNTCCHSSVTDWWQSLTIFMNVNWDIMDNDVLYYPKELSWLAFNERVLQEAADKNNPAVERIRFLGIYSNNLDEFYRVRAADVKLPLRKMTAMKRKLNAKPLLWRLFRKR